MNKWQIYEREKRKILSRNLSQKDYEIEIKKLVKKLGI
jgi:hypothetical protein